jgi:Asp-tRNA(Asn)/Glu-tRNA(Gln) amidotransferase A subunit family amidase
MDLTLDVYTSAREIAAAVRSRTVSARAVTERALARIDEVNGPINAFTVVLHERALAAADAVDQDVARGTDLPLAGVPVAVKDHVWLAGAVATNGSRVLADFVPDRDCVAVERLHRAGAIIVGKTTNPEFCYRGDTESLLWGVTRNPWDLALTPGGSSGGSGAAVATGMVALAVGTDGGGSIRIPAAFCGVAGHKPTMGLVPALPGFRGWPTLSVTGPIARTVGDVAAMLSVMAGPDPADPGVRAVPADLAGAGRAMRDLRGLRVAASVDFGFARVDAEVRAAFDEVVAAVKDLGADVIAEAPTTPDPVAVWTALAAAEGYASEGPLLDRGDVMSDDARATVISGAGLSARDYLDAQYERRLICTEWSRLLQRVDVVISPGEQVLPFPVGHESPPGGPGSSGSVADWWGMDVIANLTGQPSASVPTAVSGAGLPTGIQVMGRPFADALVLDVAATIEARISRMPPGPPNYQLGD